MSLKILKWNIKGHLNNYNQLIILIKTHSPHIISLQETHTQYFHTLPTPINYNILTNIAPNRFGGVALLIHKSIQHTQSTNNKDVEAIAPEMKLKQNFKIYYIYISPNKSFSRNNLNNVINMNNETVRNRKQEILTAGTKTGDPHTRTQEEKQ